MAHAALAQLVRHRGLVPQQLNYLETHPAFTSAGRQSIIKENRLLRELDSSDLCDDLFDRCLFSRNVSVQRTLLNKAGISKRQLATLSDYGANRAIRNIAKEQLRKSS